MQILRAADRQASPWKNGRGVTWEIAASPEGSTLEDFDWRLSVAEVASSGPFSSFPGVDRVLTVIEGAGLRLQAGREEPIPLDYTSPPLAFAGDEPCTAELAGAPIRDTNVMVRRGVFAARVWRAHGPLSLRGSSETLAVLALAAGDVNNVRLELEDLALAGLHEQLQLGPGSFLVVELTRI